MNGQATRYVWSLNLFVCFAFLPQILSFFKISTVGEDYTTLPLHFSFKLPQLYPRCPPSVAEIAKSGYQLHPPGGKIFSFILVYRPQSVKGELIPHTIIDFESVKGEKRVFLMKSSRSWNITHGTCCAWPIEKFFDDSCLILRLSDIKDCLPSSKTLIWASDVFSHLSF